jgi:hypothetical protein
VGTANGKILSGIYSSARHWSSLESVIHRVYFGNLEIRRNWFDSDRIVFWNPRSNRPNKEAFQKFLEAASEIFLVSPRANLFREPVFSLSGNAERRERIRRRNFLREIGVGFWDSFRGYLGGLKAPQLRTRFRPFVIGAGLPAPRLQVRACEPFNAAFYIVAMAAFCLFLDRPAPFVIFYLKINNMIEIVNDRKFIITCGN